jgi:hypothetical protein
MIDAIQVPLIPDHVHETLMCDAVCKAVAQFFNNTFFAAGMGGASSRKAAPPPIQDSNPPASLQKATVSGRKGSIDQQSNSKHRTQIHIFFGSHGGTAEQFTYNLKSTLNSKGDYSCEKFLTYFIPFL